MSETLGLYPYVIVDSDNKHLCFSIRNSNCHLLLNIIPEHYSIKGNTITFLSDRGISDNEIALLINSRFAYRLLKKPGFISGSSIHSLTTGTNFLNNTVPDLFEITFILDKISTLPAFHYPYLTNNCYSFSDDVLKADFIRDVLRKFGHIKRIRLLSNDILSSNIPLLPEFKEYEIETIVNQDYYLTHFEDIMSYPKSLKLIVYLDNISHFDVKFFPVHFNRVIISYFCPINNLKDLTKLEGISIPVFPFPSNNASESVIHSLLDYSVTDLLNNRSNVQQFLFNNVINPLFYGNVIVNNAGDILSYPFCGCDSQGVQGKGNSIKDLKKNYYWTILRSAFFEKCRNCALLRLCPPLTNYEINLHTTFCKKNF